MDRLSREEVETIINEVVSIDDKELITGSLQRLRDNFTVYDEELSHLESVNHELQGKYEKLKDTHLEMFMKGNGLSDALTNASEVKKKQNEDVKRDSHPKTFGDLFKKREG